MKFTVLNTYDALVQKARKIQQLARFFNRQEAANGQLKSSYTGQSSIFYILDFSQSRFLYVDPFYENMLHLPKSKPSPENFICCLHPNDLKVLQQKIIPDVLHFFGRKPADIHGEFTISFNYRLRKSNGDYLCAMQRSSRILSSETGNSIAVTGFIIDISPFKEDSKMILNIERTSEKNNQLSSDSFTSVYYPDAESHPLSNRELEILQQIGKGLCSKEIAKKLYISEFTVNNHRKKMLKKTGCRNTSELMNRVLQDKM